MYQVGISQESNKEEKPKKFDPSQVDFAGEHGDGINVDPIRTDTSGLYFFNNDTVSFDLNGSNGNGDSKK